MPGDDLGRVADPEQFARRRTLQQWHRLPGTDNRAGGGGFQEPRPAAGRRKRRRATDTRSFGDRIDRRRRVSAFYEEPGRRVQYELPGGRGLLCPQPRPVRTFFRRTGIHQTPITLTVLTV